jgi:hypothetical protein
VDSVSDFSMAELSMAVQHAHGEDEEPDARGEPVDAALLARRRQFRSWVARGMAGLALFTVIAMLVSGLGRWAGSPARSPAAASQSRAVSAPAALVAPPATEAPQTVATVAASPSGAPSPMLESLRDVKLPPPADAAGLARWSSLARSATAEELADVDAELAKLVKTRSVSVRDRSRLARALLWRERGRGSDVQAVFDDLALHAKSRDVRAAARTNQTH